MRKKRDPETAEQRHQRLADEAHSRSVEAAAADSAIDAMVTRSIKLYGA